MKRQFREMFRFRIAAIVQIPKLLQRISTKHITELGVILSLLLTVSQLHAISKENISTAEKYISKYENVHLSNWPDIKKLWEGIFEKHLASQAANSSTDAEKQKQYDKDLILGIAQTKDKDLRKDLDRMALHFKSVVFCVEDNERCDKERIVRYYRPHICPFVSMYYEYIKHKYEDNWSSERGDLIGFNKEANCALHERKQNKSTKS